MRGRFAALLVVALVGLGVPVVAAGASPRPDLQCDTVDSAGKVVAAPTTDVRLRHDLNCDIELMGSNASVAVDLNGHTVNGSVSTYSTSSTITLERGQITGSLNYGGTVTLSQVHLHGDIAMCTYCHVYFLTVQHSEVDGMIRPYGCAITLDHDVFHGTVLVSDDFCNVPVSITKNIFVHTSLEVGASFLHADVSGTIANNLIIGSSGPGISVDQESSILALTIRGNWLINNAGDGLSILGFTSTTDRPSPTVITIKGNLAIGNGGSGVDATTYPELPGAIVDGGHNVALGNKVGPQCVGVTCGP